MLGNISLKEKENVGFPSNQCHIGKRVRYPDRPDSGLEKWAIHYSCYEKNST